MANRLILGKNPSTLTFQFRISKPGVNVLTAAAADLMLSEAAGARVQNMQNGQVNVSAGASQAVSWSNFGVVPFMFFRVGAGTGATNYFYPTLKSYYHSLTATGCTFQNASAGNLTFFWFAWKI